MRNNLLVILSAVYLLTNNGALAQAKATAEFYENGAIKTYKDDRFYDRKTESGELAYRESYVTLDDYSRWHYEGLTEEEFQSLIGTIKEKYEVTYLTDEKIVRTNVTETFLFKHPNSYRNFERVENTPIRMSYEDNYRQDRGYFFYLSDDDWNVRYYDGVVSIEERGQKCIEIVYISGVYIETPTRNSCEMVNVPDENAQESDAIVLDGDSYIYNLSEFLKVFLYDMVLADFEYRVAYKKNYADVKEYRHSNSYLLYFDHSLRGNDDKVPAFPFGKEWLEAELVFKSLEGDQIAVSSGMNNDKKVILAVDPVKWASASTPKKWYIIYHELGHDILNLNHGEGGRMMFNFPVGDYTWEDFFKDRDYMFKYVFDKHYQN